MKDGSIVIEIESSEEEKIVFFKELEELLQNYRIKHKNYKVDNDRLIAPIISSGADEGHDTTEVLELHVPFYKLTKLETPNEIEAKQLLEEQLENELEISIMFQREKGLTTTEIDKMDVQELLDAKRQHDRRIKNQQE